MLILQLVSCRMNDEKLCKNIEWRKMYEQTDCGDRWKTKCGKINAF